MKKLLSGFFAAAPIFVLLLTITLNLSFAQPKDVEGWRGTKWGMNEKQLLENFKGEAVKLKITKKFMSKFSTVGINEITLDSNKYMVYFLFDTSNTLQQVNMNLTSAVSNKKLEEVLHSLKDDFSKTYGKPTAEKDNTKQTFRNIGAIWVFPTTVIMMDALMGNSDQIIVLFTKNKGQNPKKLGYNK